MNRFQLELASIVIMSVCFLVYHAVLYWYIVKHPGMTAHGQNQLARAYWVKLCIEERRDLLVVQTLRNVMMSSSLLATTALTLSSVIAAFFIRSGEDSSKIAELTDQLSDHFTAEHKLFAMILLFMLSFFSYMQSVRITSHAGLMFVIPNSGSTIERPSFLSNEYISQLLFRANMYHTFGTRLFYAAFLTVLWLFGPIISCIASTLLLSLLFFSDYTGISTTENISLNIS